MEMGTSIPNQQFVLKCNTHLFFFLLHCKKSPVSQSNTIYVLLWRYFSDMISLNHFTLLCKGDYPEPDLIEWKTLRAELELSWGSRNSNCWYSFSSWLRLPTYPSGQLVPWVSELPRQLSQSRNRIPCNKSANHYHLVVLFFWLNPD